jgi:hypothetical protein
MIDDIGDFMGDVAEGAVELCSSKTGCVVFIVALTLIGAIVLLIGCQEKKVKNNLPEYPSGQRG